jgi:hypothetical protein
MEKDERKVRQPDHGLRCGFRHVTVVGLPLTAAGTPRAADACDHGVTNPDCEHYDLGPGER